MIFNSLSDIVNNGLCIGCGICQSIAGKNSISIDFTAKGSIEPTAISAINASTFKKIVEVCPGTTINGMPKESLSGNSQCDLIWGHYLKLSYAWSSDEKIRFQGSSGGVLSTLAIHLLETQQVDFIVHTVASKTQPMRSVARMSHTKEEVLNASNSRYGPAASLANFHEALNTKKSFAFIGKPCDIGAIRNLAKSDKRVNKQCKFLLTFICGGVSRLSKSQEILDFFDVEEEELAVFRYRGHGNPGLTYMETQDGRSYAQTYHEFWEGGEADWQYHFRCKICPDSIGESADITVLDVWSGGSPEAENDNSSGIIVRTQRGFDLINTAVSSKRLTLGKTLTVADLYHFQPRRVYKKKAVWARLQGMKNNNIPVPSTRGLRIEEIAKNNTPSFNQKEIEGVTKRIKKT